MLRTDPLFLLAAVACLVVVAILALGIGSFAKGGEFNRKHSNRLMRYRIAAQAVAVILIVGFAWLSSGGSN
ncbi:MAG: twin transmembrane helix small protein [Paracoccaceae bacterium]